MALKTRQPALARVAAEAARKGYTLVKKQQDSDGGTQGEATGGQIVQQEDVDRFAPYGFWSDPPADAEQAVMPKEGADAIVGERLSNPASCSVASCGHLYGAGGAYMFPGNGGDGFVEPEAGQVWKIGATATEFIAMANLVLAELNDIRTKFDAHIHAETGVNTLVPTVLMGAASSVACTKGKVE